MSARELTPKEEAFATGVASGLSQAEAYRQAYPRARAWKDESVWTNASTLMSSTKVRQRVDALQARAAEKNEITVERIVAELAKIAFGDARNVMTWGAGGVKLRESSDISDDAAAAVSEVVETTSMNGGSLKLKQHDKLGALKMLAEIKGFVVKKSELTGKDGKDLVPEAPKGVLVVPGIMDEGAWEKMMNQKGATND